VPQSNYLGPSKVLVYAEDLKLYIRVSSIDECRLFQRDLDHLQRWCLERKKYDLTVCFPLGQNR
jgi:hypothetical protein